MLTEAYERTIGLFGEVAPRAKVKVLPEDLHKVTLMKTLIA